MTTPWPNPPQIPPIPRIYSVPLKSCCPDLIEGDECDCAEFFDEMVESMRSPLRWGWTSDKQEVTR